MKSRNPILLAPIFLAATLAAYLALVMPTSGRLAKLGREQVDLRKKVQTVNIDLASKGDVERRIDKVKAELADFSALQLEPLLESYAMRAKALVGTMAEEAGLLDAEFSDLPPRALPVLPKEPRPARLHARLPIMIACAGDYAAIVSFILRVERELPHVALGGLKITPGMPTQPEIQRAEIVLEWPIDGKELAK